MQELAGRLTALDPEASASLQVIAFFDTLAASAAGIESIVRGAAVLSGVAAGARVEARLVRMAADGSRLEPEEASGWPAASAPGARVWIERVAPPHANDAMILERAALALGIVAARRRPETGALDMLLDPRSSGDERIAAARRVRLDAGPIVVVASPPEQDAGPHAAGVLATAVVPTPDGLVRLSLAEVAPTTGPAGVAVADGAVDVARAGSDARLALRLADGRHPVVRAEELGVLIELARTADRRTTPPHPDVVALRALPERSRDVLDVLVASDSVRSAAAALSLHHSSLQARHESLTRELGYDPLTPAGRVRYEAARIVHRLAGSTGGAG